MNKFWLNLALLVALLLSGCGLAQPAPTATHTPPPPTPTLEPSPTSLPPTVTPEPTLTQEPQPTPIPPPDPAAAGLVPLPALSISLMPSLSASHVELLLGGPYQPDTPPDLNGLPPHLLLTFDDQQVTADYFNPNEPQLRIFPVPAYLEMYAGAGNTSVAERIAALSALLSEKSADPPPPLPVLPGINASQALVSNVEYLDFDGGSGVAFIAYYTQGLNPVTNQDLFYFFQGLTTDGNWYVSLAYPIASSQLPDTGAGVPPDVAQQVIQDNPAYLQEVAALLNASPPTDFTPNLDQLNAMAASISFQAGGETASAQSPTPTSPPPPTAASVTRQPSPTPSRTPRGFIPTNTRPPAATAGPSQTPTPVVGDIVNITWYWTSLLKSDGTKVNVDDPDRYHFILKPDGTVSLRADCNTATGYYKLRGKRLTIDLRKGTDKDCGDDSGSDLFIKSIEDASRYDRYDSKMEIFLVDGGTLRFSQ